MSTLMVSVSGIRGLVGNGLDPNTIVKYVSAYADFCGNGKIVIGSDGRISGNMVKNIIIGTLIAKGNDIIDIGICPTPTVLYNVKKLGAVGGIQISASHNPNEWNALKLLNANGEFMTPEENKIMLNKLESSSNFKKWNELGKLSTYDEGLKNHIENVLKLVDVELIKSKKFKVVLDCVNGAGSYMMPKFLKDLGCEVIELNCEKTGIFPRLPEPIPENLIETMKFVKEKNADLAIVVDPDVDRLVLITDKGEPFIEENTITLSAKHVLSKTKGNVVVNLSTTRAVDDIANAQNCKVFKAPVGEANVVKLMKEVNAVIGGEGSGGVIYPELHYGRDALVGTVLTLEHLAMQNKKLSQIKDELPQYFIAKKKIELINVNPDKIIEQVKEKYKSEKINTEDGLRIDFDNHWVHFRKSNTEPIIRCIAEAKTEAEANLFIDKYFNEIKELMK
ncbi:MAG: phosphoglucosamine mutase [Ignavibacteriales bacterium]|nr:phosphoglucosamine mutase [Ignavibacteriales bacterium]